MKSSSNEAFLLALTGLIFIWGLFVLSHHGGVFNKAPVEKVAPVSAEQTGAS